MTLNIEKALHIVIQKNIKTLKTTTKTNASKMQCDSTPISFWLHEIIVRNYNHRDKMTRQTQDLDVQGSAVRIDDTGQTFSMGHSYSLKYPSDDLKTIDVHIIFSILIGL